MTLVGVLADNIGISPPPLIPDEPA